MCIIAYKPENKIITPDTLSACFENNPDGAGFSVRTDDGQLITQKGFFTYRAFREAYKPYEKLQSILHFRIKTHGNYEGENCHPHEVIPGLVFAHNGIIYEMPNHATKSDTVLFNELVLRNLVQRYGVETIFTDKVMQVLIAKFIGSSKLVFLHEDGRHFILGEKAGEWEDGVWFSNFTYKPRPKYTPPANTQSSTSSSGVSPGSNVVPLRSQGSHYTNMMRRTGGNTTGSGFNYRMPHVKRRFKVKPQDQIALHDDVRLMCNWGTINRHSFGQVLGFMENGDCEVWVIDKQFTVRLPEHYLERVVFKETY